MQNAAMELTAHMIQLHIFRIVDGEQEFLLLQRAADETIYPNLWQVVTGMIEKNETAVETARREALEETGLPVEQVYALPLITSFFNVKTNAVNFVPVFATQVSPEDEVVLSDEHQDWRWATAELAEQMLDLPSHREGTRLLIEALERGTLEKFGV